MQRRHQSQYEAGCSKSAHQQQRHASLQQCTKDSHFNLSATPGNIGGPCLSRQLGIKRRWDLYFFQQSRRFWAFVFALEVSRSQERVWEYGYAMIPRWEFLVWRQKASLDFPEEREGFAVWLFCVSMEDCLRYAWTVGIQGLIGKEIRRRSMDSTTSACADSVMSGLRMNETMLSIL
jgi:hypothetical protein